MTYETFLIRDDKDLIISVEYGYSKGLRGQRDSMGVPLEPDDDEAIEIIEVTSSGQTIELSKAEESEIEEELWEHILDKQSTYDGD